MTGYKVFLAKSRENLRPIIDFFENYAPCDMYAQHGVLVADDRVPYIYNGKGYYYLVITCTNVSEPFHEIVFK